MALSEDGKEEPVCNSGRVEEPLLKDRVPAPQPDESNGPQPEDGLSATQACRAEDLSTSPSPFHRTPSRLSDILDARRARERTAENLPNYAENDLGQDGLAALLSTLTESQRGRPLDPQVRDEIITRPAPIRNYPEHASPWKWDEPKDQLIIVQQNIVKSFFRAIDQKQDDVIALFIDKNFVTANTRNCDGRTPLLAAVAAGNIRIVQELIDFEAEPDAFGVESKKWDTALRRHVIIQRTPLQLAASTGNLTLVKLLIECYHCDDSLIAPDGQLALRLAAENGHREIVEYLPARRGGGWRRWKNHHAKAMARTERALRNIYDFFKFLLWSIPRFFVWTVPKKLIVQPIRKGCAWCWKNRTSFGPWCKVQVQQLPIRIKMFFAGIWEVMKAVPKAATRFGKAAWKFGTQTLPKWLKQMFLERLPKTIAIVSKWIWQGFAVAGTFLRDLTQKIASLLHTLFSALLSFFRNLTLRDVWNGFRDLLRAIFVTLPRKIGAWLVLFLDVAYRAMNTMFGGIGLLVYYCGVFLGYVAVYVPRKIWIVVVSLGGSVAKGWEEVLVWVDPKGEVRRGND